MIIETKFLGAVEFNDEDIISFENGMPGFENLNSYVMINPENDAAFSYMQSLENKDICFVLLSPFVFIPEYDIEISNVTVNKLDAKGPEDLAVYSIVTVPEKITDITANLKAPIIVNISNNKAVQEILDTDKYSIRHKIIKEADA